MLLAIEPFELINVTQLNYHSSMKKKFEIIKKKSKSHLPQIQLQSMDSFSFPEFSAMISIWKISSLLWPASDVHK